MYNFFKKAFFFTTIIVLLFTIYLRFFGGYIDYFYNKFTTPKQFSLILGESRAFSGIIPSVLDDCLENNKFKTPVYNFSFTIAQSSYGPSYLEALKRKLNTEASNQLFILQVSPWNLANRNPLEKKESDFHLLNSPPHDMADMTSNPNVEYLIKHFDNFNFKGIFRQNTVVYKNGQLVNNKILSSKVVFQESKKEQLEMFSKMKAAWTTSKYRIHWLQNTVVYLQQYGSVFIVRMPFDKEFLDLDNSFWPEFDSEIEKVANVNKLQYLNYSKQSNWNTFDGHHLDKAGAKLFTQQLCNDINKQ